MDLPDEQAESLAALHHELPVLADERIRLLTIHPGNFDDPVQCHLAASEPDSEYEALSYSWSLTGTTIYDFVDREDNQATSTTNPRKLTRKSSQPIAEISAEQCPIKENETIMVNGHSVPVMANLSAALRHARQLSTSRVLWVDFLCINQANQIDKTCQVRRMASIYANATNVIVWLGLETAADASALTELGRLAKNKHFDELYPRKSPKQIAQALLPLVNLLCRPWFNRMWVVQEIVLSRKATVRIGHLSEPWTTFVAARNMWMKHRHCCASTVLCSDAWLGKHIEVIEHAVPDPNGLWRLFPDRALFQFRWRDATNPLDKVFSLFGVLQPAEEKDWKNELVVDYSLSRRQVYEQTTLYIIRLSSNLRCISESAEFSGDESAELPSWTADLKFLHEDARFLNNSYNACLIYNRSEVQRCGGGIRMQGIVWNEVLEVGEHKLHYRSAPGSEENIQLVHAAMAEFEAMARRPASGRTPYGSEESRLEALANTLRLGWSKARQRRITREDDAEYAEWRRWLRRAAKSTVLRRLKRGAKVDRLQNEMLNARKAFYTTGGGYFGMGFPSAKVGDIVCIMQGSNVPFLLRARDEECKDCKGPCYRIVGYTYLQGIMDGEAAEEVRKGELQSAWVCIR